MRYVLILLAVLGLAAPVAAQVVAPSPQQLSVQDTGTACSVANTCAVWPNVQQMTSISLSLTGTCTSCTVTFEASDGFSWFAVLATNSSTGATATTTTLGGQYAIDNSGFIGVRARLTIWGSGGFNVVLVQGKAGGGAGSSGGGDATAANQALQLAQVTAQQIAVGNGTYSAGFPGMYAVGRQATTPTGGSNGSTPVAQYDANGRQYTNTVIYDYATNMPITVAADVVPNTVYAGTETGPLMNCIRKDVQANVAGTTNFFAPCLSDSNANIFVANGATASVTSSTTTKFIITLNSNNSTNIKASAGNIYGYTFTNPTSTVFYVKLYNLSAAPTCSSATGLIEIVTVPQATGAGAGIVSNSSVPRGFSTGIGYCVTGALAETDNTSAVAGGTLSIQWK